jgi:hypothetical protein
MRPADIAAAFRQWRQPREFRIGADPWPDDALRVLADLATARSEAAAGVAATTAEPASGGGIAERSVADIATSIWRLRSRTMALPDGMRSVTRHAESAWDALAQAGVEIRDHVNDPFDPGLALTVVAYQPTPGIDRDRVVEAIRPSVYLDDRPIQTAEVIVGTPEQAHE